MGCPCGRLKEYNECCGLVHQHLSNAKTADELMRSRYTGFVKANGPFLLSSHHSSTQPENFISIVGWAKSVKWLKLDVLNTTGGREDDEEGTVEFKAYYKEKGKRNFLHENSKFVREFGNWVYLGNNTVDPTSVLNKI